MCTCVCLCGGVCAMCMCVCARLCVCVRAFQAHTSVDRNSVENLSAFSLTKSYPLSFTFTLKTSFQFFFE